MVGDQGVGMRGTSELPAKRKGLAGKQKEGWEGGLDIEGRHSEKQRVRTRDNIRLEDQKKKRPFTARGRPVRVLNSDRSETVPRQAERRICCPYVQTQGGRGGPQSDTGKMIRRGSCGEREAAAGNEGS